MFDRLFGKKASHERTDISKRFNLVGQVGHGSMSKVWKSIDHQTGQTVAVKVLDKEKTAKFEARFHGLHKPHEGEIALSLDHPNIVKTYEFGWTLDDEMFLVMEFVEGNSLTLLVELQNEEMNRYRLRYMIQIGEALHHFHKKNWIHRDICPRNLMVTSEKSAKMIDFGLVVPNTPDFRKPGNRTGTAMYMAPELIKRQPTDQRLDIFSYAMTCYEMFTRRFPWEAAHTIDAVVQHINQPPLKLSTLLPTIDKQVEAAIMKGLAANPDERWQMVSDMVAEFREAESRVMKTARPADVAKPSLSDNAAGRSASASPTSSTARPPQPARPKERPVMPAASTASSSPGPGPKRTGEKKSGDPASSPNSPPKKAAAGKPKKRSADDDIDLNEMFAD